MRISDDVLVAYVDNELDEESRLQVERAARTDAALARRIQAHRRLRGRIAGLFADVAAEAPPERLVDAVRGEARTPAAVIDLAKARAKRAAKPARKAPPAWMAWTAAAACVVIVVGVGYRFAPRPDAGPSVGGPPGALMAQGALASALDNRLAADGARAEDMVKVGLSFRAADGHDCRTFAVEQGQGFAGLACREPAGWRLRMAIAQTPSAPPAGGYRTAASETPAPILDAVQGLISGAPFDARQEAAARASGWRD